MTNKYLMLWTGLIFGVCYLFTQIEVFIIVANIWLVGAILEES
jgi:hypothetical protein